MSKTVPLISLYLIAAGLLVSGSLFPAEKLLPNQHEVKYVILMVPHGMDLSSVTAARILQNGIDGAPLYMETLERIGYQRTYSEKNTVTDSSAAASTWACGEKFVNNEVCLHIDGRPNNPSLLELAKARGAKLNKELLVSGAFHDDHEKHDRAQRGRLVRRGRRAPGRDQQQDRQQHNRQQ